MRQRICKLIQRHLNGIIHALETNSKRFDPLLLERNENGHVAPVIEEWCSGFVQGMALDEAAWAPLMNAADDHEMLTPMLLYGTEPGWKQLEADAELAARYDEFAAMLGDCVLAIRGYWRKRRGDAQRVRHAVSPPGRNDACPCGSGKKYKKCCGTGN